MGDGLKHNSCDTTFVQTCFEAGWPDKLQVADSAYVQTAMVIACAEILRRRSRVARCNFVHPEGGLMKSKDGFDRLCRA